MPDNEMAEAIRKGTKYYQAWCNDQDPLRVYEADLAGVDFSGLDLRGIELEEHVMIGCDFTDCNLDGANLSYSALNNASFANATLNGAVFTNANLISASFKNCNLSSITYYERPRMIHQSLKGTTFFDCFFGNADFRDAVLGETHFLNCDLGYCIGLDQVDHQSSSCLDFRTLTRSGQLPIPFLRGIGLPDPFIGNIAPLLGLPFEYFSCFISYSRSDAPFARKLYDALSGVGIRAWHDDHSLLPGEDVQDAISKGIKTADKMILCCSKEAMDSWWVERELDIAFRKEQRQQRELGQKQLYLIPLDLDGYVRSKECASSRAEEIMTRQLTPFYNWEEEGAFNLAFEKLLSGLQAAVVTQQRHKYAPGERWNPWRQ